MCRIAEPGGDLDALLEALVRPAAELHVDRDREHDATVRFRRGVVVRSVPVVDIAHAADDVLRAGPLRGRHVRAAGGGRRARRGDDAGARARRVSRRSGCAACRACAASGSGTRRGRRRWGLDWHRNEGIEFTWLEQGTLPFATDDVETVLRPGDLTITRPWQRHRVGAPHVTPGPPALADPRRRRAPARTSPGAGRRGCAGRPASSRG